MQKIVFSSADLPAELDDKSRFKLWRDLYEAQVSPCEVTCLSDRPFSSRSEYMQVGSLGLMRLEATLAHYVRTPRQAAAANSDHLSLSFLRGRSPASISQLGRESVIDPGQAVLYAGAEPGESRFSDTNIYSAVVIPRQRLLEVVPDPENLVLTRFDPTLPASRHLSRYLDFLLDAPPEEISPGLSDRIDAMILDLVALMCGAGGDTAEVASMRGLRAARVREILALIQTNYADPGFSPSEVARKLGLSQRYVQELLQEAGSTFSGRVLELRLQKARAMLMERRNNRMKISEIAFVCGFAGISYFNQTFRRRFGASPMQYRSGDRSDR